MKKIMLLCVALTLLLTGCVPRAAVVETDPPSTTHPTTSIVMPVVTPEVTVPTPSVIPAATPTETLLPKPSEVILAPRVWDGNLDALTLEDFPTQLAEGTAIMSHDAPFYLVAELSEQNTWLYGMAGGRGLILRVDSAWQYFDLPYLTARLALPQIAYGDFDNDLDLELGLTLCIGSGTGVSLWDLHIIELGDTAWTDHWLNPADYQAILDEALTCTYDEAAHAVSIHVGESSLAVVLAEDIYPAPGGEVLATTGANTSFTFSGDGIAADFLVALSAPNLTPGTLFPAVIRATVVYTGSTFGLTDFILTAR